MLKLESSPSNPLKPNLKIRAGHAALSILFGIAVFLTLLSSASAQADFTLQTAPFSPDAVAPGGTSSSNITIGAINGFTGTVALSCQVSSTQTTTSTPACAVSPATVTPPASASATITTTLQTTTVGYTITITGTGPSTTHTTPPQNLTVLAVTPQFTINVQSPIVPNSVPAGSGAQGVIVINPINGYSSPSISGVNKGITLACATITPLVAIPPVCSFSYPSGGTGVPINGVPATSTITISTNGPTIVGAVAHRRSLYALWMPLPMLALVGLGAAVGGKRSRKAWGLLALFVISGALFLMPACSNITITTSALNGITPANTYTFTVIGVDANGVVSSNTTSSNSANPTLSLTVTAPTI
ncbi:MAG: hypothetical protein WB781_18775 [Candidatus Sulfotelmatobacter sp.]